MFVRLPESLQFLTLRKKSLDMIGRWLKRVEPSVDVTPATQFVVNEEKKEGVPIVTLFHEGRATGTLLLWTMQFMNLINLYMLSTWLPTIARGMGLTATAALMIGTMFQTGGAVGSIAIGRPIDKWGFFGVLIACFGGATVMIALIGQPGLGSVDAVRRRVSGGIRNFRRPGRQQRGGRHVLSDRSAFDGRRRGARHRPHRIDSRAVPWPSSCGRAIRRSSSSWPSRCPRCCRPSPWRRCASSCGRPPSASADRPWAFPSRRCCSCSSAAEQRRSSTRSSGSSCSSSSSARRPCRSACCSARSWAGCVSAACVLPRAISARRHPLRVYAWLELGIGAFGLTAARCDAARRPRLHRLGRRGLRGIPAARRRRRRLPAAADHR